MAGTVHAVFIAPGRQNRDWLVGVYTGHADTTVLKRGGHQQDTIRAFLAEGHSWD